MTRTAVLAILLLLTCHGSAAVQETAGLCAPLAYQALQDGRFREARQGFRAASEEATAQGNARQHGDCSFFLGLTAQQEAQASNNEASRRALLADALGAYREAARYKPGRVGVLNNLGQVYSLLGRNKEAVEALSEALSRAQGEERLAVAQNLAPLVASQGDWHSAWKLYQELIAAFPFDEATHRTLIKLLLERSPESLVEHLWWLVDQGRELTAQREGLKVLEGEQLSAIAAKRVMVLVADSLGHSYALTGLQKEIRRGLEALKLQPGVGAAAKSLLAVGTGNDLNSSAHRWWSDASRFEAAGKTRPSPLDAFRRFVYALGEAAYHTESLQAENYFLLAVDLERTVADPRSCRQLVRLYDKRDDAPALRETVQRCTAPLESRFRLGPETEYRGADLVAFHLEAARVAEEHGWDPEELLAPKLHRERAQIAAAGIGELLAAVAAAEEQYGEVMAAAQGFEIAAKASEKNGYPETGNDLLERAKALAEEVGRPRIEGSGGGGYYSGGGGRYRLHYAGFHCVAGPGSCGYGYSVDYRPRALPGRETTPEKSVYRAPPREVVPRCQWREFMVFPAGVRSRPGPRGRIQLAGLRSLLPEVGFSSVAASFDFPGLPPPPGTARGLTKRVLLHPQPEWTFSGAWNRTGSVLSLLDLRRSQLLAYSLRTKLLDSGGSLSLGAAAPRPIKIHTADGGFRVVEDFQGTLHWIGDSAIIRSVNLTEIGTMPGNLLDAVYDSVLVSPRRLLAFGYQSQRDGEGTTALVDIDLEFPSRSRVAGRFNPTQLDLDRYLLGNPHLAAIGEKGYFLAMEDSLTLYEVPGGDDPGLRRMRVLPTGFDSDRLPEPPATDRDQRTVAVYQALASSPTPVGLYGWNGRLYLLLKRQGTEPVSPWWLLVIDPVADQIIDIVPLPSTAPHLTVVPGPRFWAIIEKGPVEGWGLQAIPSMLLIPASVIARGSGPVPL